VRTWGGRVDWTTDPELAAAALVIANRLQPLTSLLRYDVRFQVVYEDDVSVVFVRQPTR
jgi:hypothetical protein